MPYDELDDEQARQLINSEQAYEAYRSAKSELKRRFSGSMGWKSVDGHTYLYRGRNGIWKSLGRRDPETETALIGFRAGRLRARARVVSLTKRVDRMAAVNRAFKLGHVPAIAARVLRALSDAHLSETAIITVGTNALFAYERLAGIRIADAVLETNDIDLLYGARASLKLLAPEIAAAGIAGLLRKVDRSFEILGRGGFRASNREGYIVDLITPATRDPIRSVGRKQIGHSDDLTAVEIDGLAWLVNSPKVTATVMDLRGYPAEMVAPDPRAFALHKAWLAKRDDRDPLKRRRDRAQAELVASLVTRRLPHLRFDAPALGALPLALRAQAADLLGSAAVTPSSLNPDW